MFLLVDTQKFCAQQCGNNENRRETMIPQTVTAIVLLSGVPDYFDRNKISSGGDLSHYSSASLY